MSTMDSTQHVLDEVVNLNDGMVSVATTDLEDAVLEIAFQALLSSQEYKQPRMNQIAQFERLYNNDITPKLRQLFNVPVPVFSGMLDTMASDFNDEVNLKFKVTNTAQGLIIPKVQAQWGVERDSTAPTARWNYKARVDRMNALMSGRGILLNYAENIPEYRNILEVINYSDFHCQPLGGGILENHLFVGREGIMRTMEDVFSDDAFDKKQREKLNSNAAVSLYTAVKTEYGTKLARFTSLDLDPTKNTYAGSKTINLCEFIVTYKGVRYLCTFDPTTKIWLRVVKWTDIRPSGLYPYVSWATHEDHKNFWSKGYADDLYWVADTIITMVNQELTNREKKNYNARAYDKDMFTDVQALDEAQYMPDTLVPVKGNSTKAIANGIYEFQTPELQGTINLVSFMASFTGQQVGINGTSQGDAEKGKKPTVVIAEQQQISKRTGLRSDSYKEAYAELGVNYMEFLKEYMPPRLSVQMIGENGFIEEAELRRIEVKRAGVIGCTVSSTSEQENNDNIKRQSHINAITMVAQNPNLTKYEKEVIYRDIGQFDDNEVAFLLDPQNYEAKKQIAHASKNIQALLAGKPTDVYYGADVSYLNYIENYLIDNKDMIMGKEGAFVAHLTEMLPVVTQNMQRKAKQQILKKTLESFMQQPLQPAPVAPGGGAQPMPTTLPSNETAQTMGSGKLNGTL